MQQFRPNKLSKRLWTGQLIDPGRKRGPFFGVDYVYLLVLVPSQILDHSLLSTGAATQETDVCRGCVQLACQSSRSARLAAKSNFFNAFESKTGSDAPKKAFDVGT